MNDSYVELEAHRMKDRGILINLAELSYLTFMKEEVDSYRIVVNNKSCVFQKENDPSILRFDKRIFSKDETFEYHCFRSPSAGKLLHYTVEDNGEIEVGQVYAEIEVMKMITELRCLAKGR
jgi:acetyl-CoA carboxylase/biotin carboxylase 1